MQSFCAIAAHNFVPLCLTFPVRWWRGSARPSPTAKWKSAVTILAVAKLISEAFAFLRLFEATRECISHRPSLQYHRFLIENAGYFDLQMERSFQEKWSALLLRFLEQKHYLLSIFIIIGNWAKIKGYFWLTHLAVLNPKSHCSLRSAKLYCIE